MSTACRRYHSSRYSFSRVRPVSSHVVYQSRRFHYSWNAGTAQRAQRQAQLTRKRSLLKIIYNKSRHRDHALPDNVNAYMHLRLTVFRTAVKAINLITVKTENISCAIFGRLACLMNSL